MEASDLINIAGMILVPILLATVPLAMAWSKRLKSIDNNVQAICTKLALHEKDIEELKTSPRAWHNERDEIKASLKSLEVKLR